MFPFGVNKFGKECESRNLSDTPVTRLSKVLSRTSVEDMPERGRTRTAKLARITEGIPIDLDENANQEPPQSTTSLWVEGNPNPSQLASEPLVNCEVSNSSSGYYSCATQSAPPTCDGVHSGDLTDPGLFTRRLSEGRVGRNEPSTSYDITELRRTQSCHSRGWLAKRHRKQSWPRISGIVKTGFTSPLPQLADTNSCPPMLSSNCVAGRGSTLRRYSLLPLSKVCASPPSDSPPRHGLFSDFDVPDNHLVPRLPDSFMDYSFRPQAKKQRIEIPSPESPKLLDEPTAAQYEADVTLPIETEPSEDAVRRLKPQCRDNRANFPFEIFRHQSTPVLCTRMISRKPEVPSPTFQTEPPLDSRPLLLKSVSVPTPALSEKLSRCISVLDNPNFRCDGRRPRALPVVHRMDSGLHCISVDTVAELVNGSSERQRNINYMIVDCRFPYEYDGGHIQGAINIFNHSDLILEIFNRVPAQRPPGTVGPPKLLGEHLTRRLAMPLREPLSAPCEPASDDDEDEDYDEDKEQFTSEASELELAAAAAAGSSSDGEHDSSIDRCRVPSGHTDGDVSALSLGSNSSGSLSADPAFVVIFHCEFSSQRAPDLAAFLRSIDRTSNYHRYPFLYFPEIYVMKGGYSAFYQNYPHLCSPNNYVKMSHRDYRSQFRLYRRLTKRVSSACTACIRPQHKLFDPPLVDSFGHCCSHSDQELTDSKLSGAALSPKTESDQMPASGEDKENKETNSDANSTSSSLGSSGESLTGRQHSTELSSADESPLRLAETVVRVGRRVISATLSAADAVGVTGPLLTKLSSKPKLCDPRRAPPLRDLIRNPFCADDTFGTIGTPAASKKDGRAPCTPLGRLNSAPSGEIDTAAAPSAGLRTIRSGHSLSFSPS